MDALGNPDDGGGYDPREGPFNKSDNSRDYRWVIPHFQDLVAYKNRDFGVWGKVRKKSFFLCAYFFF